MQTTTTTKPAAAANGKAKPAAKPVAAAANGKAFIGPSVTSAQLWAWINGTCGGNVGAVTIVPLPNCNLSAPSPLPFTNMQRPGNRSTIMGAIVHGVPNATKGQPAMRTLAAFIPFARKYGAQQGSLADLLAALNGGFTPSSKYWGTPYVKLVYSGKPAAAGKPATKAAAKPAKAVNKPAATKPAATPPAKPATPPPATTTGQTANAPTT